MNYYYTDEAGNVAGPVAREQLQKLVDSGLVPPTAQACYEGSEDWKPLSEFVRPTTKPKAATTTPPQTSAKPAASQPAVPTKSNQPISTTSPAIVSLLALLVALMATDLYFRFEERSQRLAEREQRQEIVRAVATASTEIDIKRMGVFTDYIKNLDAYETKSIYHQIYHANNAQLQLINLSVQEQQLMIQLLAGKK